MEKEQIYKCIHKAGYAYASSIYDEWIDNFQDDKEYLEESLNKNGTPKEDYFRDYTFEASWQAYIDCGPNGDVTNEFTIEDVTEDDIKTVIDNNLYDYIVDGIEDFIKETYR